MARRRVRSETVLHAARSIAPARVMVIGRPLVLPRRLPSLTYGQVARARARATRLDVARVRPTVVTARATKMGTLLGARITRSPKQQKIKKLCKCSSSRSADQRHQSRKFFGGYGSRGAVAKRVHVCEC